MVDVRHAVGASRMASTLRCSVSSTLVPCRGSTSRVTFEAVDVQRLLLERVGHFLAGHEQELFRHGELLRQGVDVDQDVVVAQHQELVAVLPGTSA